MEDQCTNIYPKLLDLEEHGGWDEMTEHGVSIIGGSLFNAIMGDEVIANSTHHQGISDPGSLQISAYSVHDKLIEGVEQLTRHFA